MTKEDIVAAVAAEGLQGWDTEGRTATPRFKQFLDETGELPACSDMAVINQGTGNGGATAYIVNRFLEAVAIEVGQTVELGRNGRLGELKIIAKGTLVQTVFYE